MRARRIDGTVPARRMPLWVDVLVNGVVYRSTVVQLAVSQYSKVYVARRTLEQGSRVQVADFTVADADIVGIAAVKVDASLREFRLRAPLREGQVLTTSAMIDGVGVSRGDHVKLVASRGQIGIETAAIAMADAGPGQLVAVRPAGTSEVVNGRVSATGTVIIE